jgi:magnesium-transporting ATPase (P-type)
MSAPARTKPAPGKPAPADDKDDLKTLPIAEVEKKLGSSPEGLTGAEAKKRLAQYGPNEIEEKKTNALLKLLSYFWGPIPWMIEVAVVLSAVVGHWADFGIILLLLVANAGVGFWEERQAGNAIEALKAASRSRRGSNATATQEDPKPQANKADPKPDDVKPPADLTHALVERVHKLYKELGREDVRAVEELEKAKLASGHDDSPQMSQQ